MGQHAVKIQGMRVKQDDMRRRLSACKSTTDLSKLKTEVGTIRNINNIVTNDASFFANRSYSLFKVRFKNVGTILDGHRRVGNELTSVMTMSDVAAMQSKLGAIKSTLDSLASKTEQMRIEEATVGPFKKKNRI